MTAIGAFSDARQRPERRAAELTGRRQIIHEIIFFATALVFIGAMITLRVLLTVPGLTSN